MKWITASGSPMEYGSCVRVQRSVVFDHSTSPPSLPSLRAKQQNYKMILPISLLSLLSVTIAHPFHADNGNHVYNAEEMLMKRQTMNPPDGALPTGNDPAKAPLIKALKAAPTFVDMENMLQSAGESYVFDFMHSPLTGSAGKDGFRTLAYNGNFPASVGSGMAVAWFALGPCGDIPPHSHPRGSEIMFLVSGGPMRFGISLEAGGPTVYEYLRIGQSITLPQGSIHYGTNLGCDPTTIVSMFNSEDAGLVLTANTFFGFDDESIAASLGLQHSPVDVSTIPAVLNIGTQTCTKQCGLSPDFDISTVSKLQVMEASLAAFANRLAAGDLNTTASSNYSNGASDFPPAVALPPVIKAENTINMPIR
ncbi:RmlC-like cupin [Atractiella rhizophila]|nr:RmlC-like cupin [Atractiella rhizophila]